MHAAGSVRRCRNMATEGNVGQHELAWGGPRDVDVRPPSGRKLTLNDISSSSLGASVPPCEKNK